MTDYFRYDVHFVMNITDIDDKVSLYARLCLHRFIHAMNDAYRLLAVHASPISSQNSARKLPLYPPASSNKFSTHGSSMCRRM